MYLDYFGLEEEPFSMTPDPRFIFFSHQHEAAAESLVYGINQRKGFLLLTGEIGTGKTTLCREVMNRLDGKTEVSAILNPLIPVNRLLKAIIEDFGHEVDPRRGQDQLHVLNQFLLSRANEGQNSVLLIDEAQNLSIEALEMVRLLSNLETDKQKLLQIVLVGQPELEKTLNSHCLRQLNQRIGIRQRLAVLNFHEMNDYIYHRLSIAGCRGQIHFKKCALKMIFRHTRGSPRMTNVLCDRVLLAAFARNTTSIDKRLVLEGIHDLGWHPNGLRWRFWACR